METNIAVPVGLIRWGMDREREWGFPWASELVAALEALEALSPRDRASTAGERDEPPRLPPQPAPETASGGPVAEPEHRLVVLTLAGDPDRVRASERLLARLEALVYEAVRAKRVDILVYLDFWTAEAFKLRFTFGSLTLGTGEDVTVTYAEGRVIIRADMRWPEIEQVVSMRDALRVSFGKHMAIEGGEPSPACARCGSVDAMMGVEFDDGSRYCWDCYAEVQAKLASRRPVEPTPDASGLKQGTLRL